MPVQPSPARQKKQGVFGAPATVEQAPAFILARQPATAGPSCGPIGTNPRAVRGNIKWGQQRVGVNPLTCKPIFAAPAAARLRGNQVSTTAQGCGAYPGPVRPVGSLSPQFSCCVAPGSAAAPQSSVRRALVIAAVVLVGLYILTGWTIGRLL